MALGGTGSYQGEQQQLFTCLSLHGRIHDLLFALGGTLLVNHPAGSMRKCAPTSVGVIGALSYLAVLPLYFMLHVYLDVYIVLYCGGGFWPPHLFCLDS